MIRKLVLPAILCLTTALSGCVQRPYSGPLTPEEHYSFYLASRDDAEHAALAAAEAALEDRRFAVALLRELSNRYQIAGREKMLAALDAPSKRRVADNNVVSAQLRAPAPRTDPTQFAMLVDRCAETVSAGAGKATYVPKLFDWLCRASVLPEANNRLLNDGIVEDSHTADLGVAIDRLIHFAERCKGFSDAYCGDADKLIAELINQQPVAPVPQRFLGRISTERPAPTLIEAPGPAAAAAPATQSN